ncbi:hypothetical protein [Leifsonia sp. NPDC080035]|uniref:Uncharacterized protein n=1 Tax=Leifsonia sp. NPDC080035 TaxID=3143936 RepID=A0AAU7GBA4_9MICO
MAEFEIAVTRGGARMLVRVVADDDADARRIVARAMGDAVLFEPVPARRATVVTAPTGLPFLLQASAAGMTAVLLGRLAALAEAERRAAISAC